MNKNGYVRVAAVTNEIIVANTEANAKSILEKMDDLKKYNVDIAVFPELCITGYTCADLFFQSELLEKAKMELNKIRKATSTHNTLFAIGLPIEIDSKLYNVMMFIQKGKFLGMVPKTNIPNYNEFYEKRYFAEGRKEVSDIEIKIQGETFHIPFGRNLLLKNGNVVVAGEICEDLWVPNPPSTEHALHGANIILNASASNEIIGKSEYRRSLVKNQSARLLCGYVYASAGLGESTQDLVFSGHDLIAENGTLLEESQRFHHDMIVSDIDMERIMSERRKMSTFKTEHDDAYRTIPFDLKETEDDLIRYIDKAPFVPNETGARGQRCDEILNLQAAGLKKRLEHIGCKKVVIGVSGGLDSTLALLVANKAVSDPKDIIGISMPCFGTTDRTKNNAAKLMDSLKVTKKEISIKESVEQHLKDLEHDMSHDITYENAQARERTQLLMDYANKENAIVIGTGDMSELALGWCTYNGDHMSMYAVNSGVPKTLVKYLVLHYADEYADETLKDVLYDIVNTPISPELIPDQKTEDKIGPYELHDFFLYQILRYGYRPTKVYELAKIAFKGSYSNDIILKWLKVFYQRFFSQQFKRSCLPDGPKIGSIALSPRGDLRMPSDASGKIFLDELNKL